jgi:hypothetical protein
MADVLEKPAEEFNNDPTLEGLWALKAVEHMQIHFNLICSISPQILKLTPKDDVVYEEFRKLFPDMSVDVIQVDQLKTSEAKEKWRPFCNMFQDEVEDWNYATLLRLDSAKDYSDDNTLLVPRIQFLAIEVARNREGHNDSIRHNFSKSKASHKTSDS